MKSIFVLKKQTENAPETFVYPLSDLQNPEVLKDFTENFQKWKSDNSIFQQNMVEQDYIIESVLQRGGL